MAVGAVEFFDEGDLTEMTIYHVRRTTSTQDVARRMLDDKRLTVGDALVADEQSAGRGRFGRRWISPPGGIYATMICPMNAGLSLNAGLALARTLRDAGIEVTLKWPNDVLVNDRKIAGVLVEQHGPYALVGMGLNLQAAPHREATCLAEYLDPPGEPDVWVTKVAQALLRTAGEPFDRAAYTSYCCTLGRSVVIEWSNGLRTTGVAEAVDEDGALTLNDGLTTRRITSGECRHVTVREATRG